MKLEIPLFREVGYAQMISSSNLYNPGENRNRETSGQIRKGQAVQDGAILELAGVVGGTAMVEFYVMKIKDGTITMAGVSDMWKKESTGTIIRYERRCKDDNC